MADVCYIRCPECDEKFKSTSDKEGKKIRCPECDEPFKVTAKMMSQPKGAKQSSSKDIKAAGGSSKSAGSSSSKSAVAEVEPIPLVEPEAAAAAPAPEPKDDLGLDEEDGKNPFGMVEVKVAARCPSCAKELLSEKDIICVHCGYNTLTREVGETKKTVEMTGQDQLAHLGPALGALGFALFALLFLLYFDLILPRSVQGSQWLVLLDSEPVRLFITVPVCFMLYAAGNFGLNVVIFTPKPKEKEKE